MSYDGQSFYGYSFGSFRHPVFMMLVKKTNLMVSVEHFITNAISYIRLLILFLIWCVPVSFLNRFMRYIPIYFQGVATGIEIITRFTRRQKSNPRVQILIKSAFKSILDDEDSIAWIPINYLFWHLIGSSANQKQGLNISSYLTCFCADGNLFVTQDLYSNG